MCGIIALLSLSNNNVIDILLAGLKQLQNRGYDSAGVCTMNKEFSMLKYASTSKLDSIKQLENEKLNILNSNIGIAHTRWATHGAKTNENSHPHISYNNKISLVHNGIIENYSELKIMLQNEGIEFKSHTDTEVIVNLIAYNYQQLLENQDNVKEELVTKAIQQSLSQLEGTWGLVILCLDYPDKLFCTRRGSPLLVSRNSKFAIVTSWTLALVIVLV